MARRPPDPIARLLAIPPQRFTAARADAAKALEEAGDATAGTVRRLRRPTGLAWVMNRLALDRRADVDALVAAGDRLRAGQRRAISGGGPEALRAAEAELRDRARALRLGGAEVLKEEGRPASQAALARLELLLRTVATAPGPARDALRDGRLEREPELAPGDVSGFAVVAQDGRALADAKGADGVAADPGERGRARREARERARARRGAAAALARARASERRADAAARAAEAAATRAAAAAARAADRARALRARAAEARAEAEQRQAAVAALGPDRP